MLAGGEALVATTEPRFQVVSKTAKANRNFFSQLLLGDRIQLTTLSELHPESPAGRWMAQNPADWSEYLFLDPYNGRGGFGASTAQFIFVYVISRMKKYGTTVDLKEIHQAYLSVCDQTAPPSGVDLLAQVSGGLSVISRGQLTIETKPWPFKDLIMYVVATGIKVPTHQHLQKVDRDGLIDLLPLSAQVTRAFKAGDRPAFIQGLKDWSAALQTHGFLDSQAQVLRTEMESWEGFVVAKGCGAMGADTVLVIVEEPFAAKFEMHLEGRSFFKIKDQVPGLTIETLGQLEERDLV